MTLERSHLILPVAVFLLLGCAAPLALLLAFSVFTVDVEAFTLVPDVSLANWAAIVTNPSFALIIGKALLSGGLTVLLAALAGYPVALALARVPSRWKGIVISVLLTPLYTGEIVRIYAWRVVLGAEGLVNAGLKGLGLIDEPLRFLLFTPVATQLVLFYNALPFMVLALWITLEFVDWRLVEAARDLGARPLQAFFRVVLPLTTPGLAAGALAVFALSAGDMLTPSLLGGTSGATPMALIDSYFGTAFDWPMASALALTLLLALFVVATALLALVFRTRSARAILLRGLPGGAL